MSDEPQPLRKLTPSGARKIPPNPDAPSLSHRREERLRPSDEISALGYDALEDANGKITAMLTEVENGAIEFELRLSDTMVNIVAHATDREQDQDEHAEERDA